MLPHCYKEPASIRETWHRGVHVHLPRHLARPGRLFWWTCEKNPNAVLLGALGLVALGICVEPKIICCPPHNSMTEMRLAKIANEAYTHWTMATGESCPSSLVDLAQYRNTKDTKDTWGNELVMVCDPAGPLLPTFGVYSLGPDGVAHTGDDITSWSESPNWNSERGR